MSNTDSLTSVVDSLKKESIIPDVIPSSENFTPSVLLSIVYPSNDAFVIGAEIPRAITLSEPEITITPMMPPDERSRKGEVTYTLVMTDPDAPSRATPTFGEWRHWVITGLTSPEGQSAATNYKALKTKSAATPYVPPSPPVGTGLHRYIFLLFEEPTKEFSIPPGATENLTERADRRNWKAMPFAKEYGLRLVGATYMLVRGPTE